MDGTALQRFCLEGIRDTGITVGDGAYATVIEYDFRGLRCVGKKIHRLLYEHAPPAQRADMLRRFEEECELLSRLHHPNIVQFLGVHVDMTDSRLPVLVMEYLPSNLSGYLDSHGTPPAGVSYSILRDVALGLRYLHEHSPPIVHRDLSANNVLLTASLSAKISDLGVAKIFDLTPSRVTQTKAPGTPCYMPPEALIDRPNYTKKIDSYSFGVLVLHVLCGRWPLPSNLFQADPHNPAVFVPVTEVDRRAEFLQQIGSAHPLSGLVCQCLSNAPTQRPEAGDLLQRINTVMSARTPSAPLQTMLEMSQTLECLQVANDRLENEALTAKRENDFLRAELQALTSQVKRVPVIPSQAGTQKQVLSLYNPHIQWRRCADTPIKTNRAQAVVIGEKVYVGGGTTPDHTDGDQLVFQYNWRRDEWGTLPRCPVRGVGIAHFHGELITVGGFYSGIHSFTGRVHRFRERSQRWEVFLPPMPTARAWLSVVTTSLDIVAAGGDTIVNGRPVVCATVEVYCSSPSQWYRADPLPTPLFAMSSVTIDNTCYLLGGTSDKDGDSKDCFQASLPLLINKAVSPGTRSAGGKTMWKRLPHTPLSRSAAVSLSGALATVGGCDSSDTLPSVHAFLGGTWVRLSEGDLPAPRTLCTAVQLSTAETVVIGGVDDKLKRSNAVFVGSLSPNLV